MKLMKLLTVGRSFKGLNAGSGHYKVQQALLPKFSSSVRPSEAAAAKAAARLAALGVSSPSVAPISTAERKPECPAPSIQTPDKTQKIPTGKILTRKPEAVEKTKFKFVEPLQAKVAAWKKRFFPPRSRKKTGLVPQQAELSLEKVSVARNDLSDADLEIVAPKAAVKTERKVHFPDLGRVKDSGREWVRMTTRMFRTTSPFQAPAEEKATEATARPAEKECELAERI